MTQLVQTPVRIPSRTVTGIALAAALFGGIVGAGVQALGHGQPVSAPTTSARDAVVLKAAQDWEARYRQMYPESR